MVKILYKLIQTSLLLTIVALINMSANATASNEKHVGDEHYTKAGFFDIHVCNWPERPLFFMALFSTTQFDNINKIEIYDNNDESLGKLNPTKYRLVMLEKPKVEKRIFIKQIEIPKTSGNGWYSTKVYMNNGKVITARDYVIIHKMALASGIQPVANATNIPAPKTLSWHPVPGASHYQVFINDNWEGRSLYKSDLLIRPELKLPKNLLKNGGSYCWRIHARDVNENVLLGDFNHGSVTKCFNFYVKD